MLIYTIGYMREYRRIWNLFDVYFAKKGTMMLFKMRILSEDKNNFTVQYNGAVCILFYRIWRILCVSFIILIEDTYKVLPCLLLIVFIIYNIGVLMTL
jgi:hypothetical protein